MAHGQLGVVLRVPDIERPENMAITSHECTVRLELVSYPCALRCEFEIPKCDNDNLQALKQRY